MQSLGANTQLIYYALYEGKTDALDANGYKTGEKVKGYSLPHPYRAYVSPNRGSAQGEPFGIELRYTNLMSTCDKTCPIKEDSILWVGVVPETAPYAGGTTPYTHRVVRRAAGLNTILFALEEVSVGCTEKFQSA